MSPEPPPTGASPPVAAGEVVPFGMRAGGAVIDGFILWVVMTVGFLFAAASVPEASFENLHPAPSGFGRLMLFVTWLIAPAYYILMEGRPAGQTIGKRLLGTRVVRKSGGGAPIGYGLAIVRFLGRILDLVTLGLGLVWAVWDPQHQTFHDKIAGTLVVRSDVYPAPGAAAPGGYQQPAPPPSPYQTG